MSGPRLVAIDPDPNEVRLRACARPHAHRAALLGQINAATDSTVLKASNRSARTIDFERHMRVCKLDGTIRPWVEGQTAKSRYKSTPRNAHRLSLDTWKTTFHG